MSVLGWFGLGIAITGGLYTFRLVAGRVAWMYDHYPDGDNVLGGIFLGLLAAALWPIVLPIALTKGKGGNVRHFLVERVFYCPHPRSQLPSRRR